jgi:ABC-type Fe3+-hydroxamate transport system substrate-binding protein
VTTSDDRGTPFGGAPPRRVVSLVPSLTEAIAATDISVLAGATDWCTHPAGLAVPRVGGTKWPDLDRVRALHPDLVVANAEENRDEDVDTLRAAGLRVWVTAPATVDEALDSLARLCVVPIWRRPWMVLGRDTFAGDVLRRLGVENVFAGSADRYPRLGKDEPATVEADLVVFPDEPYAFTRDDGPDAWPQARPVFVSGRHLTWYGPSLTEAPALLTAQLTSR